MKESIRDEAQQQYKNSSFRLRALIFIRVGNYQIQADM